MKIALLLNTDKPNCFTVAFEVCNHLKKLGAEILLDQSVRNQFLAPDTPVSYTHLESRFMNGTGSISFILMTCSRPV